MGPRATGFWVPQRRWTHGHVETTTSSTVPEETGGEFRVVVGVDGSLCAERALMLAAYEAGLRGALLHIVSAYEASPSAGWVVVPLGPLEESAAAIVSQLPLAMVREHCRRPA